MWRTEWLHLDVQSVGPKCAAVVIPSGMSATLRMPDEWIKCLVPRASVTVSQYNVTHTSGELVISVNPCDKGICFIHPTDRRGQLQVAELFAGIAGWTYAARRMGKDPVVLVERDFKTAEACARALGYRLLTARQAISAALQGDVSPAVIHDDVSNYETWMYLWLLNVAYVLASPPCQPWCGAGSTQGLQSGDGQIFLVLLKNCAMAKIRVLVCENVAGITRHPDFDTVTAEAAMYGYKLVLSGVHDCAIIHPVKRERWLGTFIEASIPLSSDALATANALTLGKSGDEAISRVPSIGAAGIRHVNISDDERRTLVVPDHVLCMLRDIAYAPKWMGTGLQGGQDVLLKRILHEGDQFVAIMASYGHQHEIPQALLMDKGLHTILMSDDAGPRYASPWEFVASLGYPDSVMLPANVDLAWKMAGNGISQGHAWLQLFRTHVAMGDVSFMSPSESSKQMTCAIQQDAIRLAKYHVITDDNWQYLELIEIREAKKQKLERPEVVAEVAPTAPFQADDPIVKFRQLSDMPTFKFRTAFTANAQALGGLVLLVHDERGWAMTINCCPHEKVECIITRGLPHAMKAHFVRIMVEDRVLDWDTMIDCRPTQIMMLKCHVRRIQCSVPTMAAPIIMDIDVTWTSRTALAFVAAALGCNVDSLQLMASGRLLKDEDFLMELDVREFQACFAATLPSFQDLAACVKACQDQGVTPVRNHMFRVCARHPNRKSARSMTVDHSLSVAQIVQTLFPDVHASVTWSAFQGDVELNPGVALPFMNDFVIQWNGFRPLATTHVVFCNTQERVDSMWYQGRAKNDWCQCWIRTPFHVRATVLRLPPMMTIGEVAARFYTESQVVITLMCEINGCVIDPSCRVQECDMSGVWVFRPCPMLGGAKSDVKQEALKVRLRQEMVGRGVPESLVDERISSFLAKAPTEKFQGFAPEDSWGFWAAVKQAATDMKFRLIYPGELKDLQKDNKRASRPKAERKKDRRYDQHDARTRSIMPAASDLVIDPSHFHAGDAKVEMLAVDRFGPDQAGLTVMSCAQAKNSLSGSMVKSCDPLAILVVDKQFQGLDLSAAELINVPAHTKSGNPVVVHAALIQCGDQKISFQASVMAISVNQLEATTIEFWIVKEHTKSWQDAAIPMHYLGKHVPSLRGNNLISQWSTKSWDDSRRQVHFQHASYWHGFFTVQDTLLHGVLGRSGCAGIFMNAKTQDKRHDPRFATVTVPMKNLDDVLQKCEQCPHTLGVTRVGQQFAVRCLREHVASVREHLVPESAYVPPVQVPDDQTSYVIRNLGGQVGRDELTKALRAAGWEAQAIRSQGFARWIVSAKHPPPCAHILINNALTMVEPMYRSSSSAPIPMIAKDFHVAHSGDGSQQIAQVSATTRMAEMRGEIQTQLASMVDQRLAAAHARIDELNHSLAEAKEQVIKANSQMHSEIGQMRDEQMFTMKKVQDVETSLASHGQNMLQQMQTMFQSMQSSLEKSVHQAIQQQMPNEVDPKRPKLDPASMPGAPMEP